MVEGDYIWSNPMCPEGSWVSAKYTIKFQPEGTFSHGCTAVATVTKRVAEPYEFRGIKKEGENKVIVDIKQNGICLM